MIKLKDIMEEIHEQKEFDEFHKKLSSELNEAVLNQDMESELSDEEILNQIA
jgi:hypothetical protein